MNDRNWGGKRKGAGRKKGGVKYVKISLALPEWEAVALRSIAENQGKTVSRFISDCLGLEVAAEAERKRSLTLPENLTGNTRLC